MCLPSSPEQREWRLPSPEKIPDLQDVGGTMVALINTVVSLISLSRDSDTQRHARLETGGKILSWKWEKTDFFLRVFIWGASTIEPGTLEALVSPKDVIRSGGKNNFLDQAGSLA